MNWLLIIKNFGIGIIPIVLFYLFSINLSGGGDLFYLLFSSVYIIVRIIILLIKKEKRVVNLISMILIICFTYLLFFLTNAFLSIKEPEIIVGTDINLVK